VHHASPLFPFTRTFSPSLLFFLRFPPPIFFPPPRFPFPSFFFSSSSPPASSLLFFFFPFPFFPLPLSPSLLPFSFPSFSSSFFSSSLFVFFYPFFLTFFLPPSRLFFIFSFGPSFLRLPRSRFPLAFCSHRSHPRARTPFSCPLSHQYISFPTFAYVSILFASTLTEPPPYHLGTEYPSQHGLCAHNSRVVTPYTLSLSIARRTVRTAPRVTAHFASGWAREDKHVASVSRLSGLSFFSEPLLRQRLLGRRDAGQISGTAWPSAALIF